MATQTLNQQNMHTTSGGQLQRTHVVHQPLDAEDLSSKKNVRWHVEPYLSTMRVAVQRVIRGDDTTTKIANNYKIPARTLRRYVSKEKLARAHQKSKDGTVPKSILIPETNSNLQVPMSLGAPSGPTGPADTQNKRANSSGVNSRSREPTSSRVNQKPRKPAMAIKPRQRASQPIAIQNSMNGNSYTSRRQPFDHQLSSLNTPSSLSSSLGSRSRGMRLSSGDIAVDSFSEILSTVPGFNAGTVSSTSPPSSLVDRADWAAFESDSRDSTTTSNAQYDIDGGGPPVIGDEGDIMDPGVGAGRARSGGFLVSSSTGASDKRQLGVSADLLLEALGGGNTTSSSNTTSRTNNNPRPPTTDAAEAKRRNRADSRDLLRMAFTDDDSLTYNPPPESFSTQLLRAGLRERARSSSTASLKGRSDSFDFSSWQAEFFTPPQDSHDSVLSSSLLSRVSDSRSRGNSMWSTDDGESLLMPQVDVHI